VWRPWDYESTAWLHSRALHADDPLFEGETNSGQAFQMILKRLDPREEPSQPAAKRKRNCMHLQDQSEKICKAAKLGGGGEGK
jgi:hypothetical protein